MSSPRSSGTSNQNHLHSVPTAKSVFLCKNGDLFTPPKRIIINTNSMNAFLDEVTKKIKAHECMRDVFTPKGKTHIKNISEFENGQYYVVKPGRGRFKEYNYQAIPSYKTPRKGQRQGRNNSSIMSKWYKEDNFAHHQKNSRYDDIKPRFSETGEPGIRIYIHKNAQPMDKSVLVLLRQKRLEHMQYVIEDITTELCEDSKYPVRYIYGLNGEMITKTTDFQPEEFYVAVPPHQNFKHCAYSCRRHDLPNFMINPYFGTGLPRSTYLWQDPNSSRSRPTTWTSKYNPVPPISKPSPNQSVASHPETNLRRRKIQHAQEDVHQKAVKHKRTPEEKKTRQVDYDQDNSNVFRAKDQNKSTKGAKEVKETRDTKTDLPIDQVKAEEVEEELFQPAPHHLTPLELNRRPSDEDQDYSKEDLNDQDERRSSRGHPYSKEKSDRDMNPYKVLEPIKKENRSSTPVDDDDDDDDDDARRKEAEAATKIQASFRGHQARQEVANMKKEEKTTPKEDTNKREDTQDTLNTTDAENEAAAKIQAGFRGYQTRQELKAKGHKVRPPIPSQDDTGEVSKVTKEKEDEAASKIQASFRGHQARKEITATEEQDKKNEAATLIQANFKGYKIRKELKEKKATGEIKPPKESTTEKKKDDKEATENEAATKIQASFRGYQTRQQLKDDNQQGIDEGKGGSKTVISTPPHSSEAPGNNRRA